MITPVEGGVILDLRVQPGAARTAVVGTHGDEVKVKVSAPPLDGRANDAVVALVAKELGVRPSCVELVSGASSRSKRVRVLGITADQARTWLSRTGNHVTRGV